MISSGVNIEVMFIVIIVVMSMVMVTCVVSVI